VVRPELGLMRTANLDTLVSGPYIEVRPDPGNSPRQTHFVAASQTPAASIKEAGLRLVLSTPRRGSLKAGVPVTYREVTVGKVTGFELGPNADRVLIGILIEPRYAPLVRSGSRFWNTSGFGFDFGLLKGAQLRTESLETLLEGGIAFATPEGEQMGRLATPGQTFPLFDEANSEWLQWAPKIALERERK
jgi:paraquat-inducible protein B